MTQRVGVRSLPAFLSLTYVLSCATPLWQDPTQAVSVLSALRESPSKLDVIPRHEVLAQSINYAGQVHGILPSEQAK